MNPRPLFTRSLLLPWCVRLTVLLAAWLSATRLVAETKPGSWVELKTYHSVMAATFHPAEDGNLDPVKQRSGELASVSKAWLQSKPPAEFNTPAILEKLKLLQAESAALDTMIAGKKATDAEIKSSLFKLHDRFHEIVGACRDEGKADKH